jgi:hypothetical protein
VTLRFGVDDFDSGLAFAGQHPGDDAAVGEHRRVHTEIPFDAAAGIEDVNQKLVLGMDRHACQVGADPLALAGVHVALGALILKDFLSRRRVTRFLNLRQKLCDDFFAVGTGKSARLLQHGLGSATNPHAWMYG